MSDQAAPPPRQQAQAGLFPQLMRMFLMYVVISSAVNYFKEPAAVRITPKSASESVSTSSSDKPNQFQISMMGVHPDAELPTFRNIDIHGDKIRNHSCLFKKGESLKFRLFISENYMFDPQSDQDELVLSENQVVYDSAVPMNVAVKINVSVSEHMIHNGSVFAHVYFSRGLSSGNDRLQDDLIYKRFNLVRYRKKDIPKKTYKLLETIQDEIGADAQISTSTAVKSQDVQIVPYWVPSLDISLVEMPEMFGRNAIPAAILQHLQFNDDGHYFPVVYHNDFFLTTKSLIEINASRTQVPLSISLTLMSFMRWHMQSQMEQQWKQQQALGTGSERDTDMIREVLFDTNPILLGITFVVSMLHMLFDFLAFKNDIQFWRKKKSMSGMSVQSLGVNCFFQSIIFLYLVDNDTSWMILFSSAIGLGIEYWKLAKAFNVQFHLFNLAIEAESVSSSKLSEDGTTYNSIVPSNSSRNKIDRMFGMPLPLTVSWKLSNSYTASKTREYDAIATSHLLYIVVPLVFGYSGYSLIYISHKSFYSWLLGSLVGFVYAFGFVLMTPQLFINYKLKSVAHMPWKAMVYKSLNTFIDDLFAFVIKMPLLHRLACFRDDIIFLIYLYQRWIYTVDMTRVNEFGQGGDDSNGNGDVRQELRSIEDDDAAKVTT